MVDQYLEEIDRKQIAEITKAKAQTPDPGWPEWNECRQSGRRKVQGGGTSRSPAATPQARGPFDPEQERKRYPNYSNSLGGQMFLVPSGEFIMGTVSRCTAERTPHFRVTVTRFYMSRFPITNAQYEAFDPLHKSKRAPGAGDRHPVVYVSSLEAMKFCQWLSMRERKKYRLPTEAEWEYAAQGDRWPQISMGQLR